MGEPKREPLNIVRPPHFVFKYRQLNPYTPAQNVINDQGTFSFIGVKYPALLDYPEEFFTQSGMKREWFKYPVMFTTDSKGQTQVLVQFGAKEITEEEKKLGGQLTCFQDCPFPYKGHPFPEAMQAMNYAKRLARVGLGVFLERDMWPYYLLFALHPFKRKLKLLSRVLYAYAEVCRTTIEPYVLGDEFENKYGRELNKFLARFLTKLGFTDPVPVNGPPKTVADFFAEAVGTQIGSDNAYWMRLGDAMSETTKEKILAHPVKEIRRLGDILADRQPVNPDGGRGQEGERLKKMLYSVSYLLYIPKIRRIFKECIQECDFANFQFDKADWYHSLWYADYNYLGLPLAKRLEMYDNYHKEHPPFPRRITIGR